MEVGAENVCRREMRNEGGSIRQGISVSLDCGALLSLHEDPEASRGKRRNSDARAGAPR